MSVMVKALGLIARFAPDREPDSLRESRGYLGRPLNRVDGPLKVSGSAQFTAEFAPEGLAHGVLVCSRVANGRIAALDAAAAEAAPGVIGVMTCRNAPRLKTPSIFDVEGGSSCSPSDLPIMQSDRVRWNGQPVALVAAETLEQAQYAASLIDVRYEADTAALSFDRLKADAVVPGTVIGEAPEVNIGDADGALATADVRVDRVYRTPWYNHNAIEPHATLAYWTADDQLVVFDSTQAVARLAATMADVFSLRPKNVEVLAWFVGGGFGGKGGMWQHTVIAAAGAKLFQRPIRIALSREQVYRVVGGRTQAEQRVALGARRTGALSSLIHTCVTVTPDHARYAEQCTFPARHLYATDNLYVGQRIVALDVVPNTWMRAPGESIGTFALESALDELSYALDMDPIDIRRLNEPSRDPTTGRAFSGRQLLEAYARGAARFGWDRRPRQPRSQRENGWLVGQGVATAYYPTYRFPGSARVSIHTDGTAHVYVAAHEMGMGTATVQLQQAAERLGLAIDQVSFHYGDSTLPDSPIAGGSCQTISIAAAVHAATGKLQKALVDLVRRSDGVLADATVENTEFRRGGLYRADDPAKGESFAAILAGAGRERIDADASASMPMEMLKYSMASYGAQFCEVRVREDSGETRVSRWVGSFDCGRVINDKTATSQLRGGIVMGIGMALSEEALLDVRSGRIMNASLAEYHVPVNLDVPPIEVLFNDVPDAHTPLGARGIGELGITGAAAAVANAVYHATGKRIRDLPITLDKLL